MAFKLVENNLSPTQRSRSQVKEKQAFFKRLERSLLVNVATLFKIQTYTNNLLWQCSHIFTLQQFTRKRIASEKRSATCTSSPMYQLSVTSSGSYNILTIHKYKNICRHFLSNSILILKVKKVRYYAIPNGYI